MEKRKMRGSIRYFTGGLMAALAVLVLLPSVEATASPKLMPDDLYFDADYYAQQYPDVAAAMGTDEQALYAHYLVSGWAEGRSPYNREESTDNAPMSDLWTAYIADYCVQNGKDVSALTEEDYDQIGLAYWQDQTYADGLLPPVVYYVNHQKVGADYRMTDAQATEKILALKSSFPEGMSWGNEKQYYSEGFGAAGYACHAFAMEISDLVFGTDTRVTTYDDFDVDRLRPGDLVRIGGYHTVIVVSVQSDGVTVAEGNYSGTVHWGRTLRKSALQGEITYVQSRW